MALHPLLTRAASMNDSPSFRSARSSVMSSVTPMSDIRSLTFGTLTSESLAHTLSIPPKPLGNTPPPTPRPPEAWSPRNSKPLRACRALCCTYVGVLLLLALTLTISLVVYYQANISQEYTGFTPTWERLNPLSMGLVPFDPNFAPINSSSILVADFHAHTTVSDGRFSPRELLRYSIAQGFHVVAVTDHNTITGGIQAANLATNDPEFKDKILVIPGVEYTCCRVHMNLIGINETISPSTSFPSDDELRNVIRRTHELGGLAIVNHIPWSTEQIAGFNEPKLVNHPSREQLLEWGVDGIEVVNGNTLDYRSVQFADLPTSVVRTGASKLLLVAGSDVHVPGPAFSWNLIDLGAAAPASRSPLFPVAGVSVSMVMDAIKARRTTFLYDAAGTIYTSPPLATDPAVYVLTPLYMLGGWAASSFYMYNTGMFSFVDGFCQPQSVQFSPWSIVSAFLWLFLLVIVWFGAKKVVALIVRRWRNRNNAISDLPS